MKERIKIYSNLFSESFIQQVVPTHKLIINKINFLSENNNEDCIIFFNNDKNTEKVNLSILTARALVISFPYKNLNFNNKNIKLVKTPTTISNLSNIIKKFVSERKLVFNNIIINKKKITNIENNFHCYLTDIENDILTYLLTEDHCDKNFVKNEILNIKVTLETNSLESHLSRIRKKLEKIKSKIKILTKNDKINLSY